MTKIVAEYSISGNDDSLRVEYHEVHSWLRHIELTWWAFGAVLLPITVVFLYKGWEDMMFLLCAGSALIFTWWMYMAFTKFMLRQSLVFMDRAREIENRLGLDLVAGKDRRLATVNNDRLRELISPKGRTLTSSLFESLPSEFRFYHLMYGIFALVTIYWLVMVFYTIFSQRGCQ